MNCSACVSAFKPDYGVVSSVMAMSDGRPHTYAVTFFRLEFSNLLLFQMTICFDFLICLFLSSDPYSYLVVLICVDLRFPGMKGPVTGKAKAKGAAKPKPGGGRSSEGTRTVSTKRYSQKYLDDVPVCHMRQWLNAMDSVCGNHNVTKKYTKEDCLQVLSFSLGFHPRDAPVES